METELNKERGVSLLEACELYLPEHWKRYQEASARSRAADDVALRLTWELRKKLRENSMTREEQEKLVYAHSDATGAAAQARDQLMGALRAIEEGAREKLCNGAWVAWAKLGLGSVCETHIPSSLWFTAVVENYDLAAVKFNDSGPAIYDIRIVPSEPSSKLYDAVLRYLSEDDPSTPTRILEPHGAVASVARHRSWRTD